jgi:hypothetical protein
LTLVAGNPAELHARAGNAARFLDERGQRIRRRVGEYSPTATFVLHCVAGGDYLW